MFNFKKLKLNKEVNETDPFVGIRRSKSGNEMEFRLPRGFVDFPENDFDETKELFFRMYRTFKKFERDHSGRYIDEKQGKRDNIEKKYDGYSFLDSEGSEVVLYSKISVIEKLLEAYADLSLDVIERQIGVDEKVDYSKIDSYLDKAIYQEENLDEYVIYIDSMELPRNVIQYKSATLIDMFCFILYELNNELKERTDSRIQELSSKFKEQHLSYDHSLFNEETFEETILILKDLLQNIDKSTAYKDNDYWRLYEAIESFLYGELDMNSPNIDGVFWGISNFYQIWEDMCNTYILSKDYNILFIDKNIKLKNRKIDNHSSIIFFLEFRKRKKLLRPDVVLHKNDFFPSFVKFEKSDILNNEESYFDFSLKLLEYSKENYEIYNAICDYFTIKKKGFRPIRGVEQKSGKESITYFRSYPKKTFTQKKNRKEAFINKISPYILLDYKYVDQNITLKKNLKIDFDITKQLCYEFSLQCEINACKITSQFVIPFFYAKDFPYKNEEDKVGFKVPSKELYHRLNESRIEVFKANLYTMQDAYLAYD